MKLVQVGYISFVPKTKLYEASITINHSLAKVGLRKKTRKYWVPLQRIAYVIYDHFQEPKYDASTVYLK